MTRASEAELVVLRKLSKRYQQMKSELEAISYPQSPLLWWLGHEDLRFMERQAEKALKHFFYEERYLRLAPTPNQCTYSGCTWAGKQCQDCGVHRCEQHLRHRCNDGSYTYLNAAPLKDLKIKE